MWQEPAQTILQSFPQINILATLTKRHKHTLKLIRYQCIIVRWSHSTLCSEDSPLILSVKQTDRLTTALASGGQERHLHIKWWSASEALLFIYLFLGGGHQRMQAEAICVLCPRDNSAAIPHVWLRRRGGGLPFFS